MTDFFEDKYQACLSRAKKTEAKIAESIEDERTDFFGCLKYDERFKHLGALDRAVYRACCLLCLNSEPSEHEDGLGIDMWTVTLESIYKVIIRDSNATPNKKWAQKIEKSIEKMAIIKTDCELSFCGVSVGTNEMLINVSTLTCGDSVFFTMIGPPVLCDWNNKLNKISRRLLRAIQEVNKEEEEMG